MSDTVQKVLNNQLCCQCGTCVAVCPVDAIEMRETPAGMLTAFILDEKCIACGECLRSCPGPGVKLNLPNHVDPFQGEVYCAFVGHANEEVVRAGGQSGGVVSGLLLYLLETGRIDSALVTSMPQNGSLRPMPKLARTRQDILSAQGSKYCPVATNAILKSGETRERIATVGVSCHMHGINKLAQNSNTVAANIQYRIGLFCDRTLLYTCIDQMARDAKLGMGKISGLEYRSKARNGWPGEVCFHLVSGENQYYPSSLRMRLKDYFTPPRCRLCFDKMNILADLSVGDAWGISESNKGDSVIIARNEKGLSLLKEATRMKYLTLREISPYLVFKAQNVDARRVSYTIFSDLWREMGYIAPKFEGIKTEYLAHVDISAIASCRKLFLFNKCLVDKLTKSSVLASVKKQHFVDKFRTFILKLFIKKLF